MQGDFTLARLGFRVAPNVHSAVAVVEGVSLAGLRTDGITAKGRAGTGRVIIVGTEPIIDAKLTNSQIALTLYALPGASYTIEKNNSSDTPGGWTPDNTVTPTDLRTDLPLHPITQPIRFFRARTGGAPTLLSIRLDGNKVVLEWSIACANCVLMEADSLKPDARWTRSPLQPQVVGGVYRVELLHPDSTKFYRLQQAADNADLRISLHGNQVVIDWPMSCANCVLLQSPNVGRNALWTPSTAQPQVVNDRYQVTLPVGDQHLFLRLQPPP